MGAVAPGFQKLQVALYASHIFKRAGPLPIQTPRIWRLIFRGGSNVLNGDLMFPRVAEIILIEEGGARPLRLCSSARLMHSQVWKRLHHA